MAELSLKNIRIVSLGVAWAVPRAVTMLADLGAEVIKVESIQAMDVGRGRATTAMPAGAYPDGIPGERPYNRRGLVHHTNRNNLGITLDLSRPRGREVFRELVKITDVVAVGYPPRTSEKLGVTYAALKEVKPDIIMLSMPAFGSTGPESNYTAWGASQEQMAGLTELTGYIGDNEMPMKSGIDYGDPTAGETAAGFILAALRYRRKSGNGQLIDISQCEATSMLIGEAIMDYSMNKRLWKRMGNRDPVAAPQGCYRCSGEDKWVAISVCNDDQWAGFCEAIGEPFWCKEDKFSDVLGRRRNHDELDRLISEWTGARTHYEVMELMQEAGVPAGAVLNAQERRENSHLNERGFFLKGTHPEVGTHYYQGPPMKLSKTPITIRRLGPSLGEHNEYVLRDLLGMSKEEIALLEKEQIIGTKPLSGADKGVG
jgi:crotonobetainyl-CoA:carnitine CoA-transferase CaiB-like acyl-CoA transferase